MLLAAVSGRLATGWPSGSAAGDRKEWPLQLRLHLTNLNDMYSEGSPGTLA